MRTVVSLHLRRITAHLPSYLVCCSSSGYCSSGALGAAACWLHTSRDVLQHGAPAQWTIRCSWNISHTSDPEMLAGPLPSASAMDHLGPRKTHHSQQRQARQQSAATDALRARLHIAACTSAPTQSGMPSTDGMLAAAIVPPSAALWVQQNAQRRAFSSAVALVSQQGYVAIEEPSDTEYAPAEAVPTLLRASHWITAQRGRSFEDRGLRVRIKVRARATHLPSTDAAKSTSVSVCRGIVAAFSTRCINRGV